MTVRVPQEERTRAMRQRLLDATVECLVERGWSGTSTTLVSQRAGVSRGAQLHHFPTKADLVLAAVEHLSDARRADLEAAAAELPTGRRRTRAVLEMLAVHFTGPVFSAALELWVAARTDEALREAVGPLEQRIGRETHHAVVGLLGFDQSQPGARELVQATLDLVRGLGLANTLTDDAARRAPDPRRVGPGPGRAGARMNDRLASVLADLRLEGDQIEALVAPLPDDADGWRAPTPAAGWDVAHQVAHLAWTDETALFAVTDRARWDAAVLEALEDPDGFVDVEAARGADVPASELLDRWRTSRARPRGGAGRRARGHEDPVVRTADERHLDGDRAVHGDLGARPRRRRRPRGRAPGRRPGPARRPPRRAHPRLRLREPRPRRARVRRTGLAGPAER